MGVSVCLSVSSLHFRFSFSSRREAFRLRRCVPSGCARTLVTTVVLEMFFGIGANLHCWALYRDISSVPMSAAVCQTFQPVQ